MSLKDFIEREPETIELSCEGVSVTVTKPGVGAFIRLQTTAENGKPEEFAKEAVALLAEINTEGYGTDEIGGLGLDIIQELVTQALEKGFGGSKK